MKVLYITPSLDNKVGGPPQVVKGYCQSLHKKGIDIKIYTLDLDLDKKIEDSKSYTCLKEGIETHFFRYSRPKRYLYSPDLKNALNKTISNFDLAHIHGIWVYPVVASSWSCQQNLVPYVVSLRGSLFPHALRHRKMTRILKSTYAHFIERPLLNKAQAIHCTKAQEEIAVSEFGIYAPTFVVPSGTYYVDPETLEQANQTFVNMYPKLASKKIILFLGRISPIKGIDRLIQAFKQVTKINNDAHLILAGPDNENYARHVKTWIKNIDITDRVTFTGYVEGMDKLAILARATVLCLCSYQEAHSLVLNEAMMCGVPVIVTPKAGIDEIENEQLGIEVQGTSEQIANAIIKLLNDNQLRQQLANNAREFASQHLTWDSVTDRLIQQYEKILANKKFHASA